MARYRVAGTTAATAATAQHCIAAIWNPSATRRILVVELSLVAAAAPGAGAGFHVHRLTARGTPGSTVTPVAGHSDRGDAVPSSGFLLDLAAYTVQPTLVGADLWGWVLAAVAASGVVYPFAGSGVELAPGTGLALVNRAAIVTPASEVAFVVDD